MPKSLASGLFVQKHGFYFRRSDQKWITRFRCLSCRSTFSHATLEPEYGQRKRHVNPELFLLLTSSVSLRRTAKLLHVDRKTVSVKLTFLSRQAEKKHEEFLKEHFSQKPCMSWQMDELESFEHTKCKPVHIPLAVEEKTRLILGFDVCSAPADGRLARIALQKYGPRLDERKEGLERLLKPLIPFIGEKSEVLSDSHPFYPPAVRTHFPKASHKRVISRAACIVGQGELKKGGFDPLFSLNHTAAMLRANVSRLVRKTWCTTKKMAHLREHVSLYVLRHNQTILARMS